MRYDYIYTQMGLDPPRTLLENGQTTSLKASRLPRLLQEGRE